ncbi:hypothetical protein BKA93DRAFT_748477 [Sparassis latifolia]
MSSHNTSLNTPAGTTVSMSLATRHSPTDELEAAMFNPSSSPSPPALPIRPTFGKRPRSSIEADYNENDDLPVASDVEPTTATLADPLTPQPAPLCSTQALSTHVSLTALGNQSLKQLAKKLIKKSRLSKERLTEVETFASSALNAEQNLRLFIKLQEVQQEIGEVRKAQAEYRVSDYLAKNIQKIATAVLLSVNLPSYLGAAAVGPVQASNPLYAARLKHDHFDMPENIEHNPADWAKVKTCIQYHQTQV